ncbi:unnamed protein product [Owenia fusiformis]|uniref:Uncharacterized protein n=1 Tax=Owenia fusiformis TaxID=6347 RepID=A0A8S4P1C2_OWEFU|nr:unnamed protein product [Owenia fusiformis]
MTSMKDKVILITGASAGVGAACAEHFASLGAKLSITGRNEERLNKIKVLCIEACNDESNILATKGDVTITEDLERIVTYTLQKFGRLDVLVNNAATLKTGGLQDTTMELYDSMMNTNMRSAFELSRLVVPYLKKTKGAIVNVSSVAGPRPFPKIMAYAVSKAAMDHFTRCLAQELAPDGVRVNSVNPGTVDTEMYVTNGIMTPEQFAEYKERQCGVHPLGRIASGKDVAQAVAFLASSESSFVTGTNMLVDGGRAGVTPHLVTKE